MIRNKLFKHLIILGTFAICGISLCNANSYSFKNGAITIAGGQDSSLNETGYFCMRSNNSTCNATSLKFYNASNEQLQISQGTYYLYCFNEPITIKNTGGSNCTIQYYTGVNSMFPSCPTCPTCPEQYTSLECQTEYNLIPINDVNANYCKLNFDLIEATDCPGIGEGTGEINRTARYINDVQYPGTASLRIDINDMLEYSTTYNSGETLVDVIGYDADEDYINDIIDKEQITPTTEDIEYFIEGLANYIPIIFIAMFLILIATILKKVFKL